METNAPAYKPVRPGMTIADLNRANGKAYDVNTFAKNDAPVTQVKSETVKDASKADVAAIEKEIAQVRRTLANTPSKPSEGAGIAQMKEQLKDLLEDLADAKAAL